MTEPSDTSWADVEQMPAYERVAHFVLVDHPAVRQDLSDGEVAGTLGLLCHAYAEEERYDEAVTAGLRALRLARERAADDSGLLAHVLLNLGVAHSRNGDLEKGLAAYLEGWTHARRGGDEQTLMKAGTNALLALESGRPVGDAEFAFLKDCDAVFEAADRLSEAARASRLFGEALLVRGHVADAIAVLDRVLVTTESLGSARTLRAETTRLLEEADRRIAEADRRRHPAATTGRRVPPGDGAADSPRLGPGVLREVRALVDDGVESTLRRIVPRTRTCFSRAVTLLERRRTTRERLLAAFLLLVGARLAHHEEDEPTAIELLSQAEKELDLLKPSSANWVKARAHDLDLGELSALARNVAAGAREEENRP
ncbi:tetratricopeptide repeat protein [Streptomyces mangrovisoli]|uniref:Tetratricopeptide repeat protein n=1 Tax=Streptomyces mangrovisoli TaxID=1428628 RepID=A0A1J4NMH8_9ACTN|nr:tetratricopeptide repeat protein [Streptomyces mangrovisoli]OIJ63617.1 hypothetical protein WN71_032870 [Streptomyces mangrovisoli]